MKIPLRLGPLGGKDVAVFRSGAHWLLADGEPCRANEAVAFFNIAAEGTGRRAGRTFGDQRTLQVAVAPAVSGRLRIAERAEGGTQDALGIHPWREGDVIGELDADCETTGADGQSGAADRDLRMLFLAGRRMAWAVHSDTSLLPGWHASARAWWGDDPSKMRSLLGIGICDVSSVLRGAKSGFLEFFETTPFPAHLAQVSEHPMVPCALMLAEQMRRTPAEREAIAADLARGLAGSSPAPSPDDWVFAGAFLRQLNASAIVEGDLCLTPAGLANVGPPGFVLLSLASEPRALHRHKRLGYHVYMLAHDVRAAGPAVRAWLKSAFEPVRRTVDDIRRDMERLISVARVATGARFLVLNRMSSSGLETIYSYSAFKPPLGESLSYVAAKEMNVMLDDLAADQGVSIIDLDARAAELGGARHLPDGIHLSARLEAAVRADIVAALAQ